MNRFERDALDRYITGNWGEDSVPDECEEDGAYEDAYGDGFDLEGDK